MKKIFTTLWNTAVRAALLLALFTSLWGNLEAQNVNLAPLATTNGNGSGGVTPFLWNWNRINDLSFGTCGGQEAFIWTTDPPNGTEYMEWEWSTQYPIDHITIHHAQTNARFLAGGTIQYWNGSTWVNHYTFSGLSMVCINDIYFPIFVSNKMRIANWVPGTGQQSNLNYREIEIWQGARPGTHATVFNTYNQYKNCGNANDSISVDVRNIGLNTLTTFWVGVTVTGTVNGSPVSMTDSVQYNGSLITGKSVTMRVHKLNTINGANLSITSWVHAPGDADAADDQMAVFNTVLGSPTSNPSPLNNNRCGSGSVQLTGGAVSGNTVFWFDSPSGGKLLGTGNIFNTPHVSAPTTSTFYAAGAKMSADSSFTTGYGGSIVLTGARAGNMFDLQVKKPLTIDSLHVHLNLTQNQTVTMYIRSGTYNGAQTNPGVWTLVERKEVQAKGYLGKTSFVLSKPLMLDEGTYGVYIYSTMNMVLEPVQTAGQLVQNTAIATMHGVTLSDTFGATYAPTAPNVAFRWNGTFFYHESCVSNTRTPVTATAKPLPVGAILGKGTNFKGTYDAGTDNQPDIVANPDEIEYSITPPTGFANSAHGSTWSLASYTIKTVNGTTVPAGDHSKSNPGSGGNGVIKYKPSASYTDSMVILTVKLSRADNGCDTTLTRYIFVAPRPDADFSFTTPCDGIAVDFTNHSTILSGTISYEWSFADGNGAITSDPSHLYATDGAYNVILKVISNFGYVDSIVKTVTVNKVPVPDFDFVNACEGSAITTIDASTLPPGTPNYTWDMGDGSPVQNGTTASRVYGQPGIYPVKLTVEVNGCVDSKTMYVTQAPRGVAKFTVDLGNCDNKTVKFTNTSDLPEFGQYSYVFKFGDGDEASGPVVNHTYTAFNSYNATLLASTDLGCVDSTTVSVSLRESPKPAFAPTGGTCTNETITFNNSTNVPAGYTNTYDWDFGDASGSTDMSPNHSYPSSGTYVVILKAFSTNGCEGQGQSSITVGEKPNADFIVNKVCKGEETKFTNNSNISNGTLAYDWDLGNSTNSTATNPTVTYGAAGNYNVRLIATASSGCKDTANITAIVAAIPDAPIQATSANTGNGAIMFATTTTGVTYKWYFGDGGTSELQNPTYTYPFARKWTVKLVVVSPDGCTNSSTSDVVVNPLGVEGIAANSNMVVYPNPGTGLFFMQYKGQSEVKNIKITDMLGKLVTEFAPAVAGDVVIDLSAQKAGVYFVTVTDAAGKVYSQKITVAK